MPEKSLSAMSGSSCMNKNIYYKQLFVILHPKYIEATVVPILKTLEVKYWDKRLYKNEKPSVRSVCAPGDYCSLLHRP